MIQGWLRLHVVASEAAHSGGRKRSSGRDEAEIKGAGSGLKV